MSKQQPLADHPIVENFTDAFPSAWDSQAVHESDKFHDDRRPTDGRAWFSGDKVSMLVAPECDEYGFISLADYEAAEYVDTATVGDTRCYRFTAGERPEPVAAERIRTFANNVFDVEYRTIKQWAYTIPDADILGVPDGAAPVMFDVPDEPFRLLVAPVFYPDE